MANFIAGAIKHPGALTAKAKAAGESTQAFATEHEHDSGTTGQQARFAKILNRVRPVAEKRGYLKKKKGDAESKREDTPADRRAERE